MSTELESRTKFALTRYWGGADEGCKIQVTEPDSDYAIRQNMIGAIQLTAAEAMQLANDLREFAIWEAARRQAILREEIKDKQIFEKTIFQEMSRLDLRQFQVLEDATLLVLKFNPTTTGEPQ